MPYNNKYNNSRYQNKDNKNGYNQKGNSYKKGNSRFSKGQGFNKKRNNDNKMEIISYYTSKEKDTIEYKKFELKHPDEDEDEKETCRIPIISSDTKPALILEASREFYSMVEDMELFGETDILVQAEDEAEHQEKIRKKAKAVSRKWKSCMKGSTMRKHWDELVEEHLGDDLEMSKTAFDECMKVFLKEEMPNNAVNIMLAYMKETKKPGFLSSRKWLLLLSEWNNLRSKLDPNTNVLSEEDIIRECVVPNMPNEWLKDFIKDGYDAKKSLREVKIALENCERLESILNKNGNHNGNFRNKNNRFNNNKGYNRNKGNKCRIPGHDHDWKDCPNNPRNKKNNNEQHKNENEDDDSQYWSDECEMIRDNEESCNNKIVIRKRFKNEEETESINDSDYEYEGDSENESEYDSDEPNEMPMLITRKKYKSDSDDDTDSEPDIENEILREYENEEEIKVPELIIKNHLESDDESSSDESLVFGYNNNEAYKDERNNNQKKNTMGAEILVSANTNDNNQIIMLGLLDTGSSATLIKESVAREIGNARIINNKKSKKWNTKAGTFVTKKSANLPKIKLPQFTMKKEFDIDQCNIFDDDDEKYDIIIGRETQQEIGLDVINSRKVYQWHEKEVAMMPQGYWNSERRMRFEPNNNNDGDKYIEDQERYDITKMKENKYENINLNEEVEKLEGLNEKEREIIKEIWKKNIEIFKGTVGEYNRSEVELKFKENANKRHQARAYSVPTAYEKLMKEFLEDLVEKGVLTKADQAEWLSPVFCQGKKNGGIRLLTDLRKLNEQLEMGEWPMGNIDDIMHSIGNFTYVTAIDQVMGYYCMSIKENDKKYLGIIVPWGIYIYNRLPQGLKIAGGIFQREMMKLFEDFIEFIKIFIDDILVIGRASFEEHMKDVEKVIIRMKEAGLQINIKKSKWAVKRVEYLGYIIKTNGYEPDPKKISGLINMQAPKSQRQIRRFIGGINFYRKMWKKRSHILSPITKLTGNKKFKWGEEQEKAFNNIKAVMIQETMLAYPNFNETFYIYTDASDYQMGAMVCQKNDVGEYVPILFHSRKLNQHQLKYTTTDKELLSIVDVLLEYRNILLGMKIVVRTDHKNLTHGSTIHSSARVQRHRLILEEYGVKLEYVEGENNDMADSLSRMDRKEIPENEMNEEIYRMKRTYKASNDVICPVDFRTIYKEQRKEESKLCQQKNKYVKKEHCDMMLWLAKPSDHAKIEEKDYRIYVPESLRKQMVDWYHINLLHPGGDRTYYMMKEYFFWPGMKNDVKSVIKKCKVCQMNKITAGKSYGLLPVKDNIEKMRPWNRVFVDTIGPWEIRIKEEGKTITHKIVIYALTMIEEVMGWPEIVRISDKTAYETARTFDREWLSRYPRPQKVHHDNGSEFIGEEYQELLASYGIKSEAILVKNARANLVERLHLTIGDMIRCETFDAESNWGREVDVLLSNCAWAIRSTCSTVTGKSPGQLLFGRDMIMQIAIDIQWEEILRRKQQNILKANAYENEKRIEYKYKVGDYIKIKHDKTTYMRPTKLSQPNEGPYKILKLYKNGLVKIQRGGYRENITVTRIAPFFNK